MRLILPDGFSVGYIRLGTRLSKYAPGSKMKTATTKVRWYNANIQREYVCFQEKYSKVYTTTAAVNEMQGLPHCVDCKCTSFYFHLGYS